MSDPDRLAARLAAVERALTDGDHDLDDLPDSAALADRLDAVESRTAEIERRQSELSASVRALRGYVGNVASVNESVERRADAALAAVRDDATNSSGAVIDSPELAGEWRDAESPAAEPFGEALESRDTAGDDTQSTRPAGDSSGSVDSADPDSVNGTSADRSAERSSGARETPGRSAPLDGCPSCGQTGSRAADSSSSTRERERRHPDRCGDPGHASDHRRPSPDGDAPPTPDSASGGREADPGDNWLERHDDSVDRDRSVPDRDRSGRPSRCESSRSVLDRLREVL